MGSTSNAVQTEFFARDAGLGATLSKLTGQYQQSMSALGGVKQRFGAFRQEANLTSAGLLGVGFGLGALVTKAKAVVTEFSDTQESVASLLSHMLKFEQGTGEVDKFRRSMVLARDVVEELDATSNRFLIPMDQVEQTYRRTAIAAGSLGLTQRQVMESTINVAGAAKRFGVQGEQAALTVARAIEKRAVTGMDDFSASLRRAVGPLKGLTQAAAFEKIQNALRGSAAVADEMSAGLGGSLFRIRSSIEDIIRKAATPVMGEVAKKLEAWAKHLNTAKDGARSLIDQVGSGLVSGFRVLERITGFLVDNWKIIAATIGGMKLTEGLGSLAGAFGGAGGPGAKGVAGALKYASSTIQILGTAYLVGQGLGELIADQFMDKPAKAEADRQRRESALRLASAGLGQFATAPFGALPEKQARIVKQSVEQLEALGLASGGKISRGALRDTLSGLGESARDKLAADFGVAERPATMIGIDPTTGTPITQSDTTFVDRLADKMADRLGGLVGQFGTQIKEQAVVDDRNKKFARTVQNFYGGINITQKFDDPDPDRVFVRTMDDVEEYVNRPNQSRLAVPEMD